MTKYRYEYDLMICMYLAMCFLPSHIAACSPHVALRYDRLVITRFLPFTRAVSTLLIVIPPHAPLCSLARP